MNAKQFVIPYRAEQLFFNKDTSKSLRSLLAYTISTVTFRIGVSDICRYVEIHEAAKLQCAALQKLGIT